MKTVATLPTERAYLLLAELEAAGLHAVVQTEDGGAQLCGSTFCQARVEVGDKDVPAAMEIASAFQKATQSKETRAKELAGGIEFALLSTAAGLVMFPAGVALTIVAGMKLGRGRRP